MGTRLILEVNIRNVWVEHPTSERLTKEVSKKAALKATKDTGYQARVRVVTEKILFTTPKLDKLIEIEARIQVREAA